MPDNDEQPNAQRPVAEKDRVGEVFDNLAEERPADIVPGDQNEALPAEAFGGRVREVELEEQEIERLSGAFDQLFQNVNVDDELTDEEAAQIAFGARERVGNGPGILDDEPREPGQQVMDPNAPAVPEWGTIAGLPGYMSNGIRAFGRGIFNTFPCFQAANAAARAEGRDALAEMFVLASFGERGPNRQAELDGVAGWLQEHGVILDHASVEFPNHIRDYQPRLIVGLTDTHTVLFVEERVQRDGMATGPIDGNYVYAWPGGRQFYDNALDARDALQRLANEGAEEFEGRLRLNQAQEAPEMEQEAPMAEAEEPAVEPVEVQPAAPTEEAPAVAVGPEPEKPAEVEPERKARPRAAAGVAFLRSEGFMPARLPDGTMSFKRSGEPVVVVTGVEKSVTLAKQFKIAIFEEEPAEGAEPQFSEETEDLAEALPRLLGGTVPEMK